MQLTSIAMVTSGTTIVLGRSSITGSSRYDHLEVRGMKLIGMVKWCHVGEGGCLNSCNLSFLYINKMRHSVSNLVLGVITQSLLLTVGTRLSPISPSSSRSKSLVGTYTCGYCNVHAKQKNWVKLAHIEKKSGAPPPNYFKNADLPSFQKEPLDGHH